MKSSVKIILVCSLSVFLNSTALAKKVAFIGDSITAGAVVQSDVKFEADSLWQIFMGKTSVNGMLEYSDSPDALKFERPTILPSGVREYEGAAVWLPNEILRIASWRFLNRPDYSWANMLATSLGYEAQDVLFASENGAKSIHGVSQMARVLQHLNMEVPEDIFIFFTGNDICSPMLQLMTPPEEFEKAILRTVSYVIDHGKFKYPTKYNIYLIPFLQISQLYSESLLNEKKVRAHGKVLTCGELLKTEPEIWQITSSDPEQIAKSGVIFNFLPFPKNQGAYCPSLFGKAIDSPKNDPQYHRSTIANRVRSFRDALFKVQKHINGKLKRRPELDLKVSVLESTADLIFKPQDFAEDCFHLSARGQWQISKDILQEVTNLKGLEK